MCRLSVTMNPFGRSTGGGKSNAPATEFKNSKWLGMAPVGIDDALSGAQGIAGQRAAVSTLTQGGS